jgi:hypothetical protein
LSFGTALAVPGNYFAIGGGATMKHRANESFVLAALIVFALVGWAYAATAVLAPKTTAQRTAVAPPTTNTQTTPKVPGVRPPTTGTPTAKSGWIGPTDNITKVANAIQVQAKSLNTLVSVSPGLVLSKPVTISIAYLSPRPAAGNERKTQTYVPSAGNSFLYSDPEGDGKPRKVHLDITLSELKPGGGVFSFNIPVDLMLDPLYDVSISPLVFTLIIGCSNVGANQIDLHWYAPDNSADGKYQTVHFASRERERFSIREFSWARSEVSATANLHKVVVWYAETGIHGGFGPYPGSQEENLVPGKTQTSSPGLVDSSGSTQDCQATLNYTVTYQMRTYFGAPMVRDHR